MKELFVACALALQSLSYRTMTPWWEFGKGEVTTFRLLRDYPDSSFTQHPDRRVLIYGYKPTWKLALEEAGIKTVLTWNPLISLRYARFKDRQEIRSPVGSIVSNPTNLPFRDHVFQIYVFDDMDDSWDSPQLLAAEATRIVHPNGFFLTRIMATPILEAFLPFHFWKELPIEFHDFHIWRRYTWRAA